MDNYNLSDLEKHFHIRKEEAALLFIFLTLLPPKSSIDFLNGRIEKMSEETFRLCIDKGVYRRISNDFLTEEKGESEYNEIFSQVSTRQEEER